MTSPARSRRQRLTDWIIHHPRLIARLRAIGFLVGLAALAIVGVRQSATFVPVYFDPDQKCEYNAVEAGPPPVADQVPANQTFVVTWRFANTGSCQTWRGVSLTRRNDAVPGAAISYSIGSPVADTSLPPALAGLGSVQASVELTAPAQAGIYVTEWQLQAANNQPFGPVMVRQIQVYAPGVPPAQFAPNPPQPDLFGWLRFLASLVFYALPALLAMAFVMGRAVQFMNALYGLKQPGSSHRHVVSMMFGVMSSALRVTEGQLDREPGNAAAELIGGPAWLTVADLSAAVIERGGGFSRVVGPGFTFLLPHERVRGAIDLHQQHRPVTEKVMTKDGIPVEVVVDLIFRITDRPMPGESDHEPPPPLGLITRLKQRFGLHVNPALLEASREHSFSREAVRRAVYESAVFSTERAPDWAASFANVRAGDISDELVEMRLDEILAPDRPDHPLREVPAKGLATARTMGKRLGIDVIDMTMGPVDLLKEHKALVGDQMLLNWKAEWNRRATVLAAQGQARRMQLEEEARAEAQANMIQALTEGFKVATGENPTPDVSREVITLRFIDTLEALLKKAPEEPAPNQGNAPQAGPPAILRSLFKS